jgi:hypothetical protein
MSGRYGGSGVHGGASVVSRYQHVPNQLREEIARQQ